MVTLQDLVLDTVKDFMTQNMLFTALDVSNTVKQKMPYAKHKEVRNEVRAAWLSLISLSDYDRTPITVSLADGSTAEALLYHPLSASWDLDNLYDAQKRGQTAIAPSANTASAPVTVPTLSGSVSKDAAGVITVTTTPKVAPTVVVAPVTNPKDLWTQMWQGQPSLFPKR